VAANQRDWSGFDRTKRVCRGCRKEKPLTKEYFPPDKPSHKYPSRRLRYYCRICTRARTREYQQTPAWKKYVAKNREAIRAYGKARRERDKLAGKQPVPLKTTELMLRNRARVWVYKQIRLKRAGHAPALCPECGAHQYRMHLTFPLGPKQRTVYAWRCASCTVNLQLKMAAERERLAVDPWEWREIHARHLLMHRKRTERADAARAFWSKQGLDEYEISVALGLEEVLEDYGQSERRERILDEISWRNAGRPWGVIASKNNFS
jgi:hypothetical protein